MKKTVLVILALLCLALFAVGCQQQPQTGKGWFDQSKMSDIPKYEPPTYKQPKYTYPDYKTPTNGDYPHSAPPEETKPVSDTYKISPVTQPLLTTQMCCQVGRYYLSGHPTEKQCSHKYGGMLVPCAYCCNVGGNIFEASAYECQMKGGQMTNCPYVAG